MFAAGTATSGYTPIDGDITLDGKAVSWDPTHTISNAIGSGNVAAEVTSLVKQKVDAAPAGRVDITAAEANPNSTDGETLAVIFDDPTVSTNNSVALLYGAQHPLGDSFIANFAGPIDTSNPNLKVQLGLGISFGYQPSSQYSTINVNGTELTSSAGGQDDCNEPDLVTCNNGELFTVGGLDDDPTNPPDTTCTVAEARCDDELYNLLPLLTNGVTSVTIDTVNPTNDDNLFFASLQTSDTTAPPPPPGPSKTLVAFGDSIAAGEGSGPSQGYPDNPGAYPARLAEKLGWEAQNFAISGACAATSGDGDSATPSNCTKSILSDELPLAVSKGLHPNLITITVGANDIQFGNCFQAVIGLSADNPCEKTKLKSSLNALRVNLSRSIAAIKQAYPNVPIVLTRYFNPLPSGDASCSLMPGLYLYKTIFIDKKPGEAAKTLTTGKLDSAAQDFQDDIVLEALRVIGKLNSTLQQVAQDQGTGIVALNFAGHDLCKDYAGSGSTAWVFGPSADLFISYYNRFVGDSREWQFTPLHRCTPTPQCDTLSVTDLKSYDKAGTKFTYSILFRSNDLPHLTNDGHNAVADFIKEYLSL